MTVHDLRKESLESAKKQKEELLNQDFKKCFEEGILPGIKKFEENIVEDYVKGKEKFIINLDKHYLFELYSESKGEIKLHVYGKTTREKFKDFISEAVAQITGLRCSSTLKEKTETIVCRKFLVIPKRKVVSNYFLEIDFSYIV